MMSWPEDDVDFEDIEIAHDPVLGDSLSAAELTAIVDLNRRSVADCDPNGLGIRRARRRKVPCGELPKAPSTQETPTSAVRGPVPELEIKIEEIYARQDKLASATLKSLERISRRMDKLEARPVSVFAVAPWQKACLFIFTLGMLGFTALFVMSCVMHYNGWVR